MDKNNVMLLLIMGTYPYALFVPSSMVAYVTSPATPIACSADSYDVSAL